MYAEDDFILLSGIQHFLFCRRQWALIHVEGLWRENERTIAGEIIHERAHDLSLDGVRAGCVVTHGMPVRSAEMGVSGACDVVEFLPNEAGIPLKGRKGLFIPYPVEYKRGQSKENDCDRLQLCAQAICLEEMLAIGVPEGALYYDQTHSREPVVFDDALRDAVRRSFAEMHALVDRGYTPKCRRTKACNACSMKDECLPQMEKAGDVAGYIRTMLEQDQEITPTKGEGLPCKASRVSVGFSGIDPEGTP